MTFDLSGWGVLLVAFGVVMAGMIGYVFGYAEGKERCESQHDEEES